MPPKCLPIDVRFWRFTTPLGKDKCWIWAGNKNQKGYGFFRIGRYGPVKIAHRVSWELHNGPIPDGLCVCHHCDNPSCVNPHHLFVGTQYDNIQDMLAKGRGNKGKHPCPHTRVRKLTDDAVRSIRTDGRPAHIVAFEHGIAESTVYNIKARRRKALVSDTP